jgi:hypothetical protein
MLQRTNAAVIDEWVPQIISKQPFRSTVTRIDQDTVEKRGGNVYKNEEAALRLVRQHTPGLPVPEVYHSIFRTASDGSQKGIIFMSYIEGKTLQSVWPSLHFLNDSYQIVGLVDWESAGFFPDYWEYSQMMRPMHDSNDEWQDFMRRSSPNEWDVTGIEKARRVLF